MTQGQSRKFIGRFFAVALAVISVGCGGGSGSNGATTKTASSTIILNADPGKIIAVRVGDTAILDGSSSSASTGQAVTYAWSFTSIPDASTTQLQNISTANPSFFADARGTYMVQLVVSAAGASSQRVIGFVEVTIVPEPPTGKRNHTRYPSQCANSLCHDGGFYVEDILPKSPDHIATSNMCEACHTTFGFELARYTDHQEVFGNCSVCHDGVSAIGKSNRHVTTTAECDDCHNTSSFLLLELDGSFDHTGINKNCDTCHNGIIATGKHETHIPTDGDCALCHITDNFQDVIFDHSTIVDDCEICHDGVTAIGKTTDHPNTIDACAMCHNTNSFIPAFVDHTSVEVTSQRCDDCHNNTITAISIGKSFNHMPTTDDCNVCHGYGTFTTGVYDHAGETNNCASCHDSVISTGFSENHLQTTEDCSVCHSSTTTFVGAIFVHTGIVDNCTSCHDGVISTGQKINHIPTLDDCAVCHDSTTDFTSTTFLSVIHLDISGGCGGCHNSRFATGQDTAVNHIPTEQDCHFCHDNLVFSPSIFSHSGITGNCASCHNGNYVGYNARGITDTVIHNSTTEDCGVCHNTSDFADAYVDHTSQEVLSVRCDSCHNGTTAIGKNSATNHVPTTEDCSVCHVPGTFANAIFDHTGIVNNCNSCHDAGLATPKSDNHLPTTEDCSVCHNTTAFSGARFDHTGIVNNCASCHNGNTTIGKSSNHVPTNDDCSVCHKTTGFIPATFNHTGIVDNCQSCHDGVFAIGKSRDHITTNGDCGLCHNTSWFVPATFDHTGIVNNCARSGCHGSGATGKSNNHVATNLDCSNCHTTATFVGGTWFHDSSTANNCLSCHSPGNGATPQPNRGHFDTGGGVQCDACHTTNGWGDQGTFDHCPNTNSRNNRCGDYPGDHRAGKTACTDCHKNNAATPVSYPNQNRYAPFCAGCHAGDFEREGDHNGGNNGTIEQNKDCGESGCHRVNDRNFD